MDALILDATCGAACRAGGEIEVWRDAGAATALHMVARNLWLGNTEWAGIAQQLRALGISHMVNAMAFEPGPAGILAANIGIPDDDSHVCNVEVADKSEKAH